MGYHYYSRPRKWQCRYCNIQSSNRVWYLRNVEIRAEDMLTLHLMWAIPPEPSSVSPMTPESRGTVATLQRECCEIQECHWTQEVWPSSSKQDCSKRIVLDNYSWIIYNYNQRHIELIKSEKEQKERLFLLSLSHGFSGFVIASALKRIAHDNVPTDSFEKLLDLWVSRDEVELF